MKWLFIAVVCCQLPALEGCIFGRGSECALPCRCLDVTGTGVVTSKGSCDSVTGQCDTGSCLVQAITPDFVGQLWSGDGCQTGNVALGKAASITDTGVEANNIVDGWIGSEYNCTSVDTGDINMAASVTVDLGGLYKITHILVYNTHDSAESGYLKNYYVKQGSESPSSTNGCNSRSRQVPQGGNSGAISCAPSTPVRYITIEKLAFASNKNRMTLCEIAVYGHIYHDVDCGRCSSAEQCHSDLWCEQCTGSWTGHDCNTAVGICPDNCICNGAGECASCEQWYVDPGTGCNKDIRTLSMEVASIPVIKSSTTTTLTVTFKQDNMQVDSGVQQYYFYGLQYKTAQESSYTDSTLLKQHVTDRGFRAERGFVIDGLQKNTAYQIRLVLYRIQNGFKDELAVTASKAGTTACSDRSKPTGVSATPGQGLFTVQWANLFYDPTCEHAEVDIYYSPANNGQGSGGGIRLPYAYTAANNPRSYEVANVQAGSYDVFIRIIYTSNSMVMDSDTVFVTVTALTPASTPAPPTTPTTKPASTSAQRSTTPYRPSPDPTENNPTSLPTSYSPIPQTPSSTLPQDENLASQFSCSCTFDNSQVVIPAAILSVIVLIMIVLLVVSFCYIMRLRRRLNGTKTDRVDDFSDMDKSVYYNTALGQASMTATGIQKATNGADGCEYEDVSGNKDTIHQDHTGSNVSPAEPQDSSYEAMQRQADYSNLPPPPAVYQELGALANN